MDAPTPVTSSLGDVSSGNAPSLTPLLAWATAGAFTSLTDDQPRAPIMAPASIGLSSAGPSPAHTPDVAPSLCHPGLPTPMSLNSPPSAMSPVTASGLPPSEDTREPTSVDSNGRRHGAQAVNIREAFSSLGSSLPGAANKRMSRLDLLHAAADYIVELDSSIREIDCAAARARRSNSGPSRSWDLGMGYGHPGYPQPPWTGVQGTHLTPGHGYNISWSHSVPHMPATSYHHHQTGHHHHTAHSMFGVPPPPPAVNGNAALGSHEFRPPAADPISLDDLDELQLSELLMPTRQGNDQFASWGPYP